MDYLEERNFGETIKKIRQEQQMTQKMLSQGICAQSVLSRIENGLEIPNVVVLQNICQRLNITMDQLLYSHSDDIHWTKEVYNQVHFHLIHQNYKQMEELLESSSIENHLYLDTDFQLYYYYLGSCEFYLHHAHEDAIQSLKKGLSYTYSQGQETISPIEIQLLSCLGKVFSSAGNSEKAKEHLKLAYEAVEKLPVESMSFDLTRVFFNYGNFLFERNETEQALEVTEQGILWAQQRSNYYYLEELFHLCSQICQQMLMFEEAEEYQELALCVKFIRSNGVDLS